MKKNKKILYNLSVSSLLLTSMILFSCASETTEHLTSTPAPMIIEPTPNATLTAEAVFLPEIDLVIDASSSHQRSVEIEQGQIFQIKRPVMASEWQIVFDPELFELLSPSEKVHSPGKEGWLFQAKTQGEGFFMFTSIVSCEGPIPCPMMPARLELSVVVR